MISELSASMTGARQRLPKSFLALTPAHDAAAGADLEEGKAARGRIGPQRLDTDDSHRAIPSRPP
jgi:hypothetical protein